MIIDYYKDIKYKMYFCNLKSNYFNYYNFDIASPINYDPLSYI